MFELRQYFLLFITASIWGSGFIAQKLGMEHISPFAFTFIRTFIGAIALLPLIAFLNHYRQKKQVEKKLNKKHLLIGSICCGSFLILSESFQQYGLVYSDVNKASFITALYIIFVPILGLFFGQKLTIKMIIAVVIACIGLYLFCIKDGFTLEFGDFLILICAICFAGHILIITYFVNRVDGVFLSCGQFFVASFLGLVAMLISGTTPDLESLKIALPAVLYAGIMSNGVAYTLQMIGQRGISPTIASLIMSLESVLGAILGVIFLNEVMTSREITGATLMFMAILVCQIPFEKILKTKSSK